MIKTNPEKFSWIVQRLSRSTIQEHLNEIADVVVPNYLTTNKVAIVCSSKSTDRLLKVTQEALVEGSTQYLDIVREIQEDHLDAATTSIQDKDILCNFETQLKNECLKLTKFLQAIQIISEISQRSKDKIIRIGETLTSMLVSAVLNDRGIENQVCELTIGQEFTTLDYESITMRLSQMIAGCGNRVPVLSGFPSQGIDVCASFAAVGLKAQELQLWENVDGLYTANPTDVKSAQLITIISAKEAAELSNTVIHPLMMEQVIGAAIPIRIKNAENPVNPGTLILPDIHLARNHGYATPPLTPGEYHNYRFDFCHKRPTAISVKHNINVLHVHSNRKLRSHEFLASLFKILEQHHSLTDLNCTSETHVCLTLLSAYPPHKALEEIEKIGKVRLTREMAIITLIGKKMKGMIGIAGKLFTLLADAGIQVDSISQSISEVNITCIVQEKDAVHALNIIHEELLEVDPSLFALCVQQQTL